MKKNARQSTHSPADFTLDRNTAVPALIGGHEDFLIVAGLSNTSKDIASLTHDGDHTFGLGGAMGAASMVGLGLALAQPQKRVLVVTGDGEFLMSIGSLATIAIQNPPNLAIICVDNGHYGETGNQPSHTSQGVSLDRMAAGAGIPNVRVVSTDAELQEAAPLLRAGTGTTFIVLRVKEGDAPDSKRNTQPAVSRTRFRSALLGRP